MVALRFYSGFLVLMFLALAGVAIAPALAAAGQVTIGYQGSGYYYVGDTVVFNGKNTIGNTTLIKVTGPGLPANGVPPYDLSGTAGSGNTAKFVQGTTWSFIWDTSQVDPAKLGSGRYTLTVWDVSNPDVSSTAAVILKQPAFYMTADQTTAVPGDYININGMAETGVSYVKINVTDTSGRVVHTFMSPVSATGTFSYGFHVDMDPGTYLVTGRNPSMSRILSLTLTVNPTSGTTMTVATTSPENPVTTQATAVSATSAGTPVESSTIITPGVTKSGTGPAVPLLAVSLLVILVVVGIRKR